MFLRICKKICPSVLISTDSLSHTPFLHLFSSFKKVMHPVFFKSCTQKHKFISHSTNNQVESAFPTSYSQILCLLQNNGECYQADRVGVGADRCSRAITFSRRTAAKKIKTLSSESVGNVMLPSGPIRSLHCPDMLLHFRGWVQCRALHRVIV